MERTGDCDADTHGADCAFNAALYFEVTAVVWMLTALPLLALACRRRRRRRRMQWSASRAARLSLRFVAASALCCFVHGVLASMTVGTATATVDGATAYSHAFWLRLRWKVTPAVRLCISYCIVLGIHVFSTRWCLVALALRRLHAGDQGDLCTQCLIICVGLTYFLMLLLHFPFAVMFSVHDYRLLVSQEASDTIVIVWGAWLVFGTFVLSGLAGVQCYIARVCLASVDGARSLQETALINLIQQLFNALLIVIYAVLYVADSKPDGGIIAAYHALGFIALWAMHVQVVLCFAVLRNTDPMYNQSEFDRLLSNADCSTDGVPAITVGSPGDIVINAA